MTRTGHVSAAARGVLPVPAASIVPGGPVLTEAQALCLAAVQDRLIPREGEMPGAGELGCAARVDTYLAERADWRVQVLAALQLVEAAAGARGFLSRSEEEQDAALAAVEAAEPVLFARLVRVTYTAYYTDERVQRTGDFITQPPLPAGHTMETFDATRLEPVRRRGRLWRDA